LGLAPQGFAVSSQRSPLSNTMRQTPGASRRQTELKRAIGLPEGQRRWRALGEVLHCLQDSFSPAHVDRADGEIVRMKHWGPLDRLRRGADGDEHGFPSDPRDSAWRDDALTDEALAAAEASRAYLEIAVRSRPELDEFLDEYLGG